MDRIFESLGRLGLPSLRISLAVVLGWIGALKFVDPTPVVGLLAASFSFLAVAPVVYLLGAVEVTAALLLLANVAPRWVGLLLVGLFSGTLAIFLIAPAVSYGDAGFPNLSLAGEFLLKDLVLFAAALVLVGQPAPAQARAAASARVQTAH